MYLSPHDFFTKINDYFLSEWNRLIDQNKALKIDINSELQPKFNKNFDLLVANLEKWKSQEYTIYICSDQDSQLTRLRSIFIDLEKESLCSFISIGLHQGLSLIHI